MLKDEFSLIRSLLRHRPPVGSEVEVDVGDDAAVIRMAPGRSVVSTCDTMVETVHFLPRTMEPYDIGWKCMAANVSDVAAMGGKPAYALVSLAVPRTWEEAALGKIYRGMGDLAEATGVQLVGGDTVRSPDHLVLTVALLGEVEPGQALRRSSARPGDVVFVTGELGASAAGLDLLLHENADVLAQRYPGLVKSHRRPRPRVEVGRWLLKSGWKPACDDISDGLAQEAWEIAEASGVRLVLETERIPVSSEVRSYAREMGRDPVDWALFGGEDFELIGTAPADILNQARTEGISLIEIGRVEEGTPGVDRLKNGQRERLNKRGYNHFGDG